MLIVCASSSSSSEQDIQKYPAYVKYLHECREEEEEDGDDIGDFYNPIKVCHGITRIHKARDGGDNPAPPPRSFKADE